jgi:hypothetical protein
MADPGHVATGTAEADAAAQDQPVGGAAAYRGGGTPRRTVVR